MGLWTQMSEVERVAHSMRHDNKYHLKASPDMLRLAQQYNDQRSGTTANTGEGVVGDDGLTNRERYDQRRAEEAAKQAAEQERLAALDANRPEGVSRYIWERVQNGQGFNTTMVTRDPTVRDALVGAGYEDYVKGLYESQIDSAAAHYMGNGASREDAFNTAQDPWYTQKYGAYSNGTVSGVESGLGFGHESTNPATGNPEYVAPEIPVVTPEAPGFDFGTPDFGTPANMTNRAGSTPFMDSYMRSRESAKAEGPVTGMMKKYME